MPHVHTNSSLLLLSWAGTVNSQFYKVLEAFCSSTAFFVAQMAGLIVLPKNK